MQRQRKSRFIPSHDQLESRSLLSTAVIDIENTSSYDISFAFRWSPHSAWTVYTEAPGQSEVLSTTRSGSAKPQVVYEAKVSTGSLAEQTLTASINRSNSAAASTGKLYAFENTRTGIALRALRGAHAISPSPTPTPTPTTTPTPTPTTTPTPTPTTTPTPTPSSTATTSENWSGYVAATNLTDPQADSVTAVSGSWVVPTVSASSSNGRSYSAVWVGIDGYNDSTVEQIGTSQNVVNGRAEYEVWWEMYSSGKQQPEQVVSSMTIEPGDSISASVQYISSGAHAGDFYLTITDNSRAGDSFSIYVSSAQTQSPAAERSSAEWVVEAPSLGNNVADLSDFGTVTFTSAAATINGVTGSIDDSAWQSQAINMASGFGSLEDTTSTLVDSGSSFAVTYDTSSAAQSPPGGFGRF